MKTFLALMVVGLACAGARAGADTSTPAPPRLGVPVESPSQAPAAPDAEAAGTASDRAAEARFNLREGLVGQTTDGAFRYHVGGRIDWDSGWYHVPGNIQQSLQTLEGTQLLDGTDLRRFRLGADGTVWEQFEFKMEVDLSRASDFRNTRLQAQTNIFITDAWLAMHDLPVLDTVRAGHQKEYLSFSNGTSARFLPFMERPYAFDAFENPFSWDSGVSTNRSYLDGSVTSWAGVFWNDTRSQAFNVGGHYGASGRLTWMPVYDQPGQSWLCFSASGSRRSLGTGDDVFAIVRSLVRTGEAFNVPNLLQTGTSTSPLLSHDGLEIAGAGSHAAWGPVTFGAEYLCWSIHDAYQTAYPDASGRLPAGARHLGDLFLSGYYVELLCFLTPGDHRGVNRVMPGYDRVTPVHDFRCRRGFDFSPGAWELGVRYDHVDLGNPGFSQPGRLDSLTVGLNWYLNPNTRFTVNYVYTNRETGDPASSGNFSALGTRLHFDF